MAQTQNFNVKYHQEMPVDIIVPFHGHYRHLSECIRSLVTTTRGQLFTITVVDDCSPNENFIVQMQKEKLPKAPLQYIRNKERLGFGASLAKGFEATRNQWVLLMHSDCKVVHTDWLMNMVLAMREMKKGGVKLLSAKVDNGGTGSFDPAVLGAHEQTPNIVAEQPLPLICALVHRDLFSHIGGFVKPYPIGWFEDEELFWRMKLSGYKQGVCGRAFVHHEGGTAMKDAIRDPISRQLLEENRERFVKDVQEFAKQLKGLQKVV